MGPEEIIIRCPKCGTKNRIPKERMQEHPVCGHCHAKLDEMIISCLNCGQKNRMPETRLNERPFCGKCGLPLVNKGAESSPVEISDGSFPKEVTSYRGAVLMDCWAPWCGPCRLVEPMLVELASKYSGVVKIVKLNVDDNPVTASKYNVSSIPTMLLFRNGELITRLVGVRPQEEIERQIQTLVKG